MLQNDAKQRILKQNSAKGYHTIITGNRTRGDTTTYNNIH